jgi:hypothetical protein
VRRRVAIEAAKSSFDEGTKTLEMYTGAHVPKRQFEELVNPGGAGFRSILRRAPGGARADPQTGSILVLTVDGKGVAMRPEDLREPRSALRRRGPRPSRRGWGQWAPPACQTDGLGGCHLYRRTVCAHARGDPARISPAANGACAATAGT